MTANPFHVRSTPNNRHASTCSSCPRSAISQHPTVPHPTEAQIPFLIGLSVAEAVALGVGVVFLLSGWRFVERLTALPPWVRWASYLSVG